MADKTVHETVLVVGLGRFGTAVSLELQALGHEVLAVDADPHLVQVWSSRLTHAVIADGTDADALAGLGAKNVDHAVVAIGDNVEASILCTAALVDLGVEQIWAKALSAQHATILERVGAHRVVFPERDMGVRLAHRLTGQMIDYIEIDEDFALVETGPPRAEVGRTLMEAQLRARYGVTVVSVKPEGGRFTYATPDTTLDEGAILLVAGEKDAVERFARAT